MKQETNTALTQAIQDHYDQNPHKPFVEEIKRRVGPHRVYLWGGMVRDPIINALRNTTLTSKDCDLLIDDQEIDLEEELRGIPYQRTKHGAPRWIVQPNIEIDLVSFSHTHPNKEKITLQETLQYTDVTPTKAAYQLATKQLFDAGAIQAIRTGTIDINYFREELAEALLCRVARQAHRFNFEIGTRARQYIQDHYDEDMKTNITNFYHAKNKQTTANQVTSYLDKITNTKNTAESLI